MTGASLGHGLLFCLFSFVFGMGTAAFRAVLFGVLAGARLLPSPVREEKRNKVLSFFGYLFFDLTFFVLTASAYTVFLYAVNDGVLRLYSLLLALLGVMLLHRPAERLLARPLYRLFSLPITHVGRLFRRIGEKIKRNLTKAKKSCKIENEKQKAGKKTRTTGSKHDRNQHTRALPRLRR